MRAGGYICHEFPGLWTRVAGLETALLEERLEKLVVDQPVYVTGLARSGTTILLELLAELPSVATHRYQDFPPVWTPYLWNRFLELVPQHTQVPHERPHGDGILITSESPEAMEEVLWMHFFPGSHDPQKSNRLDRATRNDGFAAFYKDHIRKLLLVRRARRYLAKGNYNVARLAYIHTLFPDARFVVPIRHPCDHIVSLMRQHELFSAGQRAHPEARPHLRRVGHFEFGLDRVPINMGDDDAIQEVLKCWRASDELGGWSRYWSHVYGSLRDHLDGDTALRQAVLVIRYEDLCERPTEELQRILAHCRLEADPQKVAASASRLRRRDYYRSGLTAAERQEVIVTAGPTMVRYGYQWTATTDLD